MTKWRLSTPLEVAGYINKQVSNGWRLSTPFEVAKYVAASVVEDLEKRKIKSPSETLINDRRYSAP